MNLTNFKNLLDRNFQQFEATVFTQQDPVSVPHFFAKKQDIEISGLFAATLAWGQRTTIIRNARKLMDAMHNAPHDFILNHSENDLKQLSDFVHRTFQFEDLLYFIYFLNDFYRKHDSLEEAFFPDSVLHLSGNEKIYAALTNFRALFFSMPHVSERTKKHVSTPVKGSACKRLNMYLRWMVRNDAVDFGIWQRCQPSELVCPLDIHVFKAVYEFHVLKNKNPDWSAAIELSELLARFDASDPMKYDFALFELGRTLKNKQ